jgi:hypothetical protein
MLKRPGLIATGFALLAISCAAGCGDSRQLEAITVSPASATTTVPGQVTFTATGQFNKAPMSVTPARVSWIEFGPGIDQTGSSSYTLTDQPVTAVCFFPGTFTVVAYAPMDPSAPDTGTVPTQVFTDLVGTRTRTQEGSFVAASAQFTCS